MWGLQERKQDGCWLPLHNVRSEEEGHRVLLGLPRERRVRKVAKTPGSGEDSGFICIAATVMEIAELSQALARARENAEGLGAKSRSRVLHQMLDEIAAGQGYCLRLRKQGAAPLIAR